MSDDLTNSFLNDIFLLCFYANLTTFYAVCPIQMTS